MVLTIRALLITGVKKSENPIVYLSFSCSDLWNQQTFEERTFLLRFFHFCPVVVQIFVNKSLIVNINVYACVCDIKKIRHVMYLLMKDRSKMFLRRLMKYSLIKNSFS